ncbi:DUF3224 domain-containing protein [Pseudonocardia oceani]|nr:DUF3224 domain-containing protein [Pseudonocardia oceani]
MGRECRSRQAGAAQLLQAIADPSAAYVGSASGGDMTVDVVPDSATGELRGLTGRLTIDRSPEGEHSYAFTYELG